MEQTSWNVESLQKLLEDASQREGIETPSLVLHINPEGKSSVELTLHDSVLISEGNNGATTLMICFRTLMSLIRAGCIETEEKVLEPSEEECRIVNLFEGFPILQQRVSGKHVEISLNPNDQTVPLENTVRFQLSDSHDFNGTALIVEKNRILFSRTLGRERVQAMVLLTLCIELGAIDAVVLCERFLSNYVSIARSV